MQEFVDQVFKLAMEQMDVLLVVAIVFIIQAAKRYLPKVPKKAWALVMVVMGFLAAWLVTPEVAGHVKEFIRRGLVYAAGSEFVYQMWRTVTEAIKAKWRKA